MRIGWRAGVAAYYGIAVQALLIVLLALAIVRFTELKHGSIQKYTVTQFTFLQRDLLRDLIDEETGVRAYVASGDPRFLDVYVSGRARVAHDTALNEGYSPGPRIAAAQEQWYAQAAQLQRYFGQEIAAVRAGQRARAVAALPAGKTMFDRLRAIEARIEAASQARLTALYGQTQRTYDQTITIATALEAVVVVSLFALFTFTQFAGRMHASANEDMLTGVANRRMALRELRRLLKQNRAPVGVLYIDLDGFKKVNDLHGHETGDAILVDVAKRLKEHIRGTDTVARLGGDEFICIIAPPVHEGRLAAIAEQVHHSLTRPYAVGAEHFVVGCSVGWVVAPKGARSAEEMLAMADRAMYQAKAGGGGVRFVPQGVTP